MSDAARVPESRECRVARWRFNWFPAYRGTGARILHYAAGLVHANVDKTLHVSRR